MLLILESVPVDYILEFRRVSKAFKKCIDTRVMYTYLERTQILGYIGPREEFPDLMGREKYEDLRLLVANFSHVEHASNSSPNQTQDAARWDSNSAIFTIDENWRKKWGAELKTLRDAWLEGAMWEAIQNHLELPPPAHYHGQLQWIVRLDKSVLDIRGILRMESWDRIEVPWKKILFNFLRTEKAIREQMEKVGKVTLFRVSLNFIGSSSLGLRPLRSITRCSCC